MRSCCRSFFPPFSSPSSSSEQTTHPRKLTRPSLPTRTTTITNKTTQFEDKYGANVDGYSPIYTPDLWSESGGSYRLGTRGLIAWAGLVVVLLGVGLTLIISTSQIGA